MSETFGHVRLSGTKQDFQKIFCPCFTCFNDLEICRLQLLNSLWQPLCEALGLLRTEISLVSLYSLSSKCRPVSHFYETVDNSSHMLQTASTVRQAGEYQRRRFSSLHEVLIMTGSGKHKGGVVVVILKQDCGHGKATVQLMLLYDHRTWLSKVQVNRFPSQIGTLHLSAPWLLWLAKLIGSKLTPMGCTRMSQYVTL